jgi:NDP-sugar pyrophosphorylase family protein
VKVVILAGGEGKRLRPLTDSVPKPLVKINGKAIIDYQIENFTKLGVKEFIVLGGYKNGELQKHFSSSRNEEVKVIVEEKPLGTGGAIKAAANSLENSDFVVINGDIMTDLDLSPMLTGGEGILGKIALVPMVSPFGVVKTFNDKVTGFEEKPMLRDVYINAGIYWLSKDVLSLLPDVGSLEKDLFPKLAADGKLGFFRFQIHNRFWRSIDNIKDHEEAVLRFK